ncbi:SDR family oxidoreductase [Evansella sp. LMS18]|uniref:SDR family NAD(P)-dependent oxidoreductase n=1 Tax=Evansella sp. LMS18 TaxID=2924033 RepID=UPI0020D10F9E|nr:SDR family oxidoreductase [Evansella sp. LMS18]UTR09524.1 SDR family oxidoreductase [Evansella sp. LMS18]
MRSDWNDLTVVITGASRGIGQYAAFEVAKRGGTPVLLARSGEKLQTVSEAIKKDTGVTPFTFTLDVTDEQEVDRVFKEIADEAGPVDSLINNAGFGLFETVEEATLDNFRAMFEVNLYGAISCTKAVLPQMRKRGSGHIIFIASLAGKLATPKSSGYSATKHALLGFANSLRMELDQSSIHISVVNPGPVRTDFFHTADSTGEYRKNVEKFMLDPEKVAVRLVNLIEKPKREVNLPFWMGLGAKLYQLFPRLTEAVAGSQFKKK